MGQRRDRWRNADHPAAALFAFTQEYGDEIDEWMICCDGDLARLEQIYREATGTPASRRLKRVLSITYSLARYAVGGLLALIALAIVFLPALGLAHLLADWRMGEPVASLSLLLCLVATVYCLQAGFDRLRTKSPKVRRIYRRAAETLQRWEWQLRREREALQTADRIQAYMSLRRAVDRSRRSTVEGARTEVDRG